MDVYRGRLFTIYLLEKFQTLTVLYLTRLGPWEEGSITRNIFKILYCKGDINILLYQKILVPIPTIIPDNQ